MPRAYPPIWCKTYDCKKCNILECNSRTLNLFKPYKYPGLSFADRPKEIEMTSIAVYFGFCQRLAKFFLLFPQNSPISAVQNNFVNAETCLPTTVSIQRIFLDMLSQGDPEAPTDDVHRLRVFLILGATGMESGRIADAEKDIEIVPSKEEMGKFMEEVKKWEQDLLESRLTFEKTSNLERCRYCFLGDCEQI